MSSIASSSSASAGSTGSIVFRDVEVDGVRCDVSIRDRRVVAIGGPGGTPISDDGGRGIGGDGVEIGSGHDVEIVDGAGGALIPGLHDHHIHLFALAAARQSLQVDPSFASTLADVVRRTAPHTWIRAVGYHESDVGEIDRRWLDAIAPDHPVRVQHRSGAMWVLNSAALRATGLDSDDGRLLRLDDELRARIPAVVPDLTAVGRELASCGVTGVSDLTPIASTADMRTLAAAVTGPEFPLDVMVTGAPSLGIVADLGLRQGPAKVIVGDHDLPSIEDLVTAFGAARRSGRAVAVHCVTRVGLIIALAAWEQVGSMRGDRIEHAAVVPVELIETIRTLGLTVVTQPSFTCERGDSYLADVDPDDLDGLWRCGSLIDAGVPVAASTDAPYGDADPWRAVAAASRRVTSSGAAIGSSEGISASRALQMFLTAADAPGGSTRRIEIGAPGDVCLLDAPLAEVLAAPSSDHVIATVGRAGLLRR